MSNLAIYLFGVPRVQVNDTFVKISRRKGIALLAYLAVTGFPQSRDKLINLLWPDYETSKAKATLRSTLSDLTNRIGKEWFEINRETIALVQTEMVWVDVGRFRALLLENLPDTYMLTQADFANMQTAVEIYEAPFLEGFLLSDADGFETWQLSEERALQQDMEQLLRRLVQYGMEEGRLETAVTYARRLINLDTLNESAHRALMRLYAQQGQRTAAMKQFETCCQLLDEELGVPPAEETEALYEQIKNQEIGIRVTQVFTEQKAHKKHNLPHQSTPFVGREVELAQIAAQIEEDSCRLLTLTGPGGIGKTRLAIEAAGEYIESERFPDGIWFIPLVGVTSVEFLTATISEAIGYSSRPTGDIQKGLFSFLQEKKLLLILDNFEHLLSKADFVSALLAQTAVLQILVTSREQLNLREEWKIVVWGLPVDDVSDFDRVRHHAVVDLFTQTAQRVRQGFLLTPKNAPHVARICQLVGGLPLGVMMAATWTQMLSCAEIADEIEHNRDFLATHMRDLPERHQSLRAVYDYSWQRLTPSQQDTFLKLSVLRGEFSREAAQVIAGASLPTLLALANSSFLRRTIDGNYEIYELLRQFALEQLQETAVSHIQHTLHAHYYGEFLNRLIPHLQKHRQKEALQQIKANIQNIRSGWLWAAKEKQIETLALYIDGIYLYHRRQGLMVEGRFLFQKAIQETWQETQEPSTRLIIARIMVRQASFSYYEAGFDEAREYLKGAIPEFEAQNITDEIAFAWHILGQITTRIGKYEESFAYYQNAVSLSVSMQARTRLAQVLNGMGVLASKLGKYQEATTHYDHSLAIARQLGDIEVSARTLNNLAFLALMQNRLDDAHKLYLQSLQLFEELGHQFGMAIILGNLGLVAQKRGSYQQAKALYLQALREHKNLGTTSITSEVFDNLGMVSVFLKDWKGSATYFYKALDVCQAQYLTPTTLLILSGFAYIIAHQGNEDIAFQLSYFVHTHPSSYDEVQERASELMENLAALFTETEKQMMKQEAQRQDLNRWIEIVRHYAIDSQTPVVPNFCNPS